jgi:hypothetical protein
MMFPASTICFRGAARRPAPAARNRGNLRPKLEWIEGRTLFSSYAASSLSALIGHMKSANTSAEADVITLSAGATYSLTAIDNSVNGPTALPRITGGGGLTIVGNGATVERSAAAGTPQFRLFDVAAGGSLTLKGLTLQGGRTAGSHYVQGVGTVLDPASGGAVFSQGALTLDGVTVRNNVAQGSSGSWGYFGYEPVGDGAGGGVYSTGTLTVSGSRFDNNFAIGGRGADYVPAADMGNFPPSHPATPSGHGSGGGLYVGGGSAAVSSSTFTGNTARGGDRSNGAGAAPGNASGGGLFLGGAATVAVRSSTVTGNIAIGGMGWSTRGGKREDGAGIGGGIYIGSGASVGLDAFTAANVLGNTASTSSSNIAGSYKRLR